MEKSMEKGRLWLLSNTETRKSSLSFVQIWKKIKITAKGRYIGNHFWLTGTSSYWKRSTTKVKKLLAVATLHDTKELGPDC